MGNQHSFCTVRPANLKQNCVQASTKLIKPTSHPKVESKKEIAVVSARKCTFVYISPVDLQKVEIESTLLIDELPDSEARIEAPVESKQQDQEVEKEVGNDLKESNYTPEAKEQVEEINRTLVQWSSFIKVKKKNYLEDYIHIREIGEGAYGTVSKIKMKYGGIYRAAKIVKKSALTQKKTQKDRFISEILIPMKTDHPNLNKLFEVFEWKNQYVLIMELCEGGDLFTCIKSQKAFTESKVAEIMKQVLSGVVYLHKNNIVHRDLKPENMLYDTESKCVKIIDFGTAIELRPGGRLNTVIGTPYYIAPEVLAGDYNEKCDVWSCGVILYILLSGSPPFKGKDESEIKANIQNQPVSFTNPIWSKRSKQSKKLVMDMLNRNKNSRLSALEVLNSDWIMHSSRYSEIDLGGDTVKNLQTFHFQNKLKAVVYTYIASQLYSNKDKEKLLQHFREIDKDGDGVIGKEELIKVLKKHNGQDISESNIDKIISLIDTNGSGQIDFTEFLVAASNEEELLQKQRLENAFSYLDTDHSGYITAQEIKPFLDDSVETSEEIKNIFSQVDQNGDGRISKKEFICLLLKKKQ